MIENTQEDLFPRRLSLILRSEAAGALSMARELEQAADEGACSRAQAVLEAAA